MTDVIIHIALVIVAVALAWQDFTSRTVHLGWLIALPIVLVFRTYHDTGTAIPLLDVMTNLIFLGTQYAGLVIYFSIRRRAISWVMDQQLGWGDLLFLLACALTFPTTQYILFVLTGLVLTLLIVALSAMRNKQTASSVPLAGWLSLYLLLWVFIDPINYISIP